MDERQRVNDHDIKKLVDHPNLSLEPTETRYLTEKNSFYKDFLKEYRYKELEEAYVTANDDLKELKVIIRILDDIEYSPEKSLGYYDEIKRCVTIFIKFWEETMDRVIRDFDKVKDSRDAMLELVQESLNQAFAAQIEFGHEYLPVITAEERKIYDDIEEKHKEYIKVLHHIKERTERRCQPTEMQEHIASLIRQGQEKTHEMFEFTRDFIGMKLVDNINRIVTILDQVTLHVKNNLCEVKTHCREITDDLLLDLYENRREQIWFARRPQSHGFAEFQKRIDKITHKLDDQSAGRTLTFLEKALRHWITIRREISDFENILLRLKTEMASCENQEQIYFTKVCKELPGSKLQLWQAIGENIQEQKKYCQRKMVEVGRVMVTHFSLKGPNNEFHNDHIGKFQLDPFEYKLYTFENGLREYHVNCDGNLEKVPPQRKKVHNDKFGRYVIDDSDPESYPQRIIDGTCRKLYQRTECASSYKLAINEIFVKVSQDCGHSGNAAECGMQPKDANDLVILPPSPPLPILKRVLESELVQYIWMTFGSIVTGALVEVFLAKPHNPIHYLAHCLVKQINKTSRSDYEELKEDAVKYSEDILKQRRDKLVANYLAARSKAVKRRKPEESDESYNWMVYYQQQAAVEFITQINDMKWD